MAEGKALRQIVVAAGIAVVLLGLVFRGHDI